MRRYIVIAFPADCDEEIDDLAHDIKETLGWCGIAADVVIPDQETCDLMASKDAQVADEHSPSADSQG